MSSKMKQAREKRIKRLRAKYGDSLKNISENCWKQAIKWNKAKVPPAI